jgi:hypothetical protein
MKPNRSGKLKQWASSFRRRWELVPIMLGAVLLLIWPYVGDKALSWLSQTQVAGVVIAAVFVFLWRLDQHLASTTVLHASLSQCFERLVRRFNYVEHMRILAISTGKIQPLIESSRLNIARCEILLLKGDATDPKSADGFNNHIEHMIGEWRRLQKAGRIGALAIRRYTQVPTEYQAIFDRSAMIAGLYSPDPDNWSGVQVDDPWIVMDETVAGTELIAKYISRFDRFLAASIEQPPDVTHREDPPVIDPKNDQSAAEQGKSAKPVN